MPDADWLNRIVESDLVRSITARLDDRCRIVVEGSCGSSTALLAGATALKSGRPVLLVVAHLDEADDAAEDLALFAANGHALPVERFAALEVLPGETSVSLELLVQRLTVVSRLAEQGRPSGGVIVAPIQALMQSVPRPEALEHYQITIEVGREFPPGRLLDWLDRAGYQRMDAIEQPGDVAMRGGIIDIFPPVGDFETAEGSASGPTGPIRLDYFGDEIESIRRIDIDTMGSGVRIERATLIGASIETLQADRDNCHLMSLLGDDCVVCMHEVMELSEQARGYYERLTDSTGIYPPPSLFKLLTAHSHVEVNQYSATTGDEQPLRLTARSLMAFDQDAASAVTELVTLADEPAHEVRVLCRNDAERERLSQLLAEPESGRKGGTEAAAARREHHVRIELGYLHRGFVWEQDAEDSEGGPGSQTWLVPHHELFHRYETRRRVRRVSSSQVASRTTDAFIDVDVGDHVVHVEHGIARFTGLKTMKRHGKTEEFLTLEFAQRALLHVPATQIDLVQKYVGGFQGKPPLSTLGGKRWASQKQAVSEAVKDLAAEMLRVQAARSALPGVRFPDDTTWQKEFEAEFPYEETEDQVAAIAQVKRDMSDEQPMDRLICGDVGFGKTEVAIRAAFKAVEFGKQVAVLVPTTVLAEQHERTFGDRMADYPFRVASLSRFKTAGEQKVLLEELQKGRIDVIIGTHRLLSKDVRFADIGLVIIDEEQRFGVEHKQKLLQFRLTADVLTLTATPIPRTLHMAMLGLRDISSLSTPPLDRRAIVTEVIPFNEQRIRQALVRELNRDGQAFFVHNRVHNIQSAADDVRRLVPDAKVIIGHGQMSSGELERVMLAFTRREADILVCTTIIESGIDIPTANTMIINMSDYFGLADLHQLRGRVGRYKHRAYCYLLLPTDRPVTDTAQRRLKALEQYSMLGAGFKIAMRDLEIRGAGNLLGSEQSGHIAAVGYELYCTLLDQQARRLRNERIVEPVRTHLELPIVGRIDRKYIPSDKFRMDAYRRLSRSATLEELEAVVSDMTDAYGELPAAAQVLVDLTEVRIAISTLGVDSLKLEEKDLIFKALQVRDLQIMLNNAPGRVTALDRQTLYYRPPENYLSPASTLLAILRKLLVSPIREGGVAAGTAS